MSYTSKVSGDFNNVHQAFKKIVGSNSRSTSFMAKDTNKDNNKQFLTGLDISSQSSVISFEDKVVDKFARIQLELDRIKNITNPIEKSKSLRKIEARIRKLVDHIPEHNTGIPNRITLQADSQKSRKYEQEFASLTSGVKSAIKNTGPAAPKNKLS